MYETMLYRETVHLDQSRPAVVRDFTETSHAAEKIVYSRTLESVSSARARIERAAHDHSRRRLVQGALQGRDRSRRPRLES
jgi:hypothetical protein